MCSTCLCIFGLYGAIQMLLSLSLLLQMLDVRGILLYAYRDLRCIVNADVATYY